MSSIIIEVSCDDPGIANDRQGTGATGWLVVAVVTTESFQNFEIKQAREAVKFLVDSHSGARTERIFRIRPVKWLGN
jgi:hypothetical protein